MYRVDLKEKTLVPLKEVRLNELKIRERYDLQEWIEKTPRILGEELLIIAKELLLPSGTRLDLLAVDKTGSLVVVELKRDESGSAVEWQAIKYVSYVANYSHQELLKLYGEYLDTTDEEAEEKLSEFIDEDLESLNESQRIILCSREFHSDVASAVLWLRESNVDVSCVKIQPFQDDDEKLYLTSDVIIPLPEAKDYVIRRERKVRLEKERPPWSGYWFVNVGEGEHRNWDDHKEYSYLSAGGGKKYSESLKKLKPGAQVFAYMKGRGYVGYGEVTKSAVPISEFTTGRKREPLLNFPLSAANPGEYANDPDLTEYCMGVNWLKTFKRDDARTFPNIFANPNIVCKLRKNDTFNFLVKEFGPLEEIHE